MTHADTLLRDLRDGERGFIVPGCRRSGKTSLAHDLARRLPGSRVSDGRDLAARASRSGPRGASREAAAMVESLRDRPPTVWIVDAAEHLLALADASFVARCVETLLPGAQIVWIRNWLVDEDGGDLAAAEAPLRARLAMASIPALSGYPLDELARSMVGASPDREPAAAWLAEWSGGLPGLMGWLHPHCPPSPALPTFVSDTVDAFDLASPARRAILVAALQGVLPPPSGLGPAVKLHAGALVAVGLLRPGFGTCAAAEAFNGRFWRECALHAVHADGPAPVAHTDHALCLEDRLQRAGLLAQVGDYLGRGVDVADAFDRVMSWASVAPGLARDPADLLGEALGRAGLVRVLRANHLDYSEGAPNRGLAERLLTLAAA